MKARALAFVYAALVGGLGGAAFASSCVTDTTPPGYTGPVPAGYHVFKSPTYGNWYITRGFQVNDDPKPGVENIKAHLRIYPLAKAANPPATTFVNVSGKAFNTTSELPG